MDSPLHCCLPAARTTGACSFFVSFLLSNSGQVRERREGGSSGGRVDDLEMQLADIWARKVPHPFLGPRTVQASVPVLKRSTLPVYIAAPANSMQRLGYLLSLTGTLMEEGTGIVWAMFAFH